MGNKENQEMRNPGPKKPDPLLFRNVFWTLGIIGTTTAAITHELYIAGGTIALFSAGGAFLDYDVQKEKENILKRGGGNER